MTLDPLLQASLAIQIHVAAVAIAIVLTFVQLLGRKGAVAHRVSGYVWASAMMVAAGSSFFIHTIRLWGPFSPIHLLSLNTIIGLPVGLWQARHHNVRGHKRAMLSLVVFALLGAGFFALALPDRIMHHVLFGGP